MPAKYRLTYIVCNNTTGNPIIVHLITLMRLICERLVTLRTPIFKHTPDEYALSISCRVGETESCMQ